MISNLTQYLIKELIENNQEYTVYIDVDDTLTDYSNRLKNTIINDPETGTKRLIKSSDTTKNLEFWTNAKWLPGAKEMFDFVKSNFKNIKILSALPELSIEKKKDTGKQFYEMPIQGKTEWLDKNVGPIEKIWVKNGKNKASYANPKSILIDDRIDNISSFEKAGGIGILADKPENIINKLKQLLNPTEKLTELEDHELKYWATYADIYTALKKNPETVFNFLQQKLSGERLKALDYFYSTYFEEGEPVLKEGLELHAQEELQRAGLFSKDSDYGGMIGEAVLELMQAFSKQGHSGMSASWVRDLFNKLSNYETITPITSDPEEWQNDKEMGGDGTLWQNKRNPSMFSKDAGKTWCHVDDLHKGALTEGFKIALKKYKQLLTEGKYHDKLVDMAIRKDPEALTDLGKQYLPKEVCPIEEPSIPCHCKPYFDSLNQFLIDKGLKIEPLPSLNIINNDLENAENFFGKTAYYNPNDCSITLYTLNRHPIDCLKSYSHEIYHHHQNMNGEFEGVDFNTTNVNEDEKLKKIEEDTYLNSQILYRSWADEQRRMKGGS